MFTVEFFNRKPQKMLKAYKIGKKIHKTQRIIMIDADNSFLCQFEFWSSSGSIKTFETERVYN